MGNIRLPNSLNRLRLSEPALIGLSGVVEEGRVDNESSLQGGQVRRPEVEVEDIEDDVFVQRAIVRRVKGANRCTPVRGRLCESQIRDQER